jgi:hypothetical protein
VYGDLVVLNHDGRVFDAVLIAVIPGLSVLSSVCGTYDLKWNMTGKYFVIPSLALF